MADTPIPQQKGLSDEELAKMQPTMQEYKWDSPTKYPDEQQITVQDKIGTSSQKTNLKNLLKKDLVFYDKARATIDGSDKYALDTCLKDFADDMADFIVSVIHSQKVMINSPVATVDTITSGILTSADKNFTFTGAGAGAGTETADTLGTAGSKIDID